MFMADSVVIIFLAIKLKHFLTNNFWYYFTGEFFSHPFLTGRVPRSACKLLNNTFNGVMFCRQGSYTKNSWEFQLLQDSYI